MRRHGPRWPPACSAGRCPAALRIGSASSLAATGGGPVFDHAARLIGMSLPGDHSLPPRLLPLSVLRGFLPAANAATPDTAVARVAPDAIYEAALGAALQVIVAP